MFFRQSLWVLAVMALCSVQVSQALTLDSSSQFQIILPDQTDNSGTLQFLRAGAECLQAAFAETLGVTFPVRLEGRREAGKPAIYIGPTQAARQAGLTDQTFGVYESLLAERDGNLYLVGYDGERFGEVKSSSSYRSYILGSLRGTVLFMEQYLQTRFLMPGKSGIDYVRLQQVDIPNGLTARQVPPLIFSGGRFAELIYDYAINDYGPGTIMTYGGHSYYTAVPKEVYGQTHPEYFAMTANGKRDMTQNHLCISNPAVQELIYAEMLKKLDAGAGTVELAQTDGYLPCLCPACQAYGGTADQGEKLWVLHRSLAERLHQERPGKNVLIICYNPAVNPPTSFDTFPPNVMIELCHYAPADFAAWKRIKVPHGFMVYIYNWGYYKITGFTPKCTPRFCAEQVRLFLEQGVRGIYRCGHGELPGMEGPVYYVYGKMLADPTQDYRVIENEYYQRCFGKVSASMRTFFVTMHERLEMMNRLVGNDSIEAYQRNPSETRLDNALPRNPKVILAAIYTPDVLAIMEKNLRHAEKASDDVKVQARLAVIRREFDYCRNLAEIIHVYNAYRIRPDSHNFAQLAELVEGRNTMLQGLFDDKGRLLPVPGYQPAITSFVGATPANMLCNGRLAAPIGAPLSWNIALLREKGILPGSGVKRMTVRRAEGEISTTDFSTGAWSQPAWQPLSGIQLGEVKTATRFKALYSDTAFYLAVETDQDPEELVNPVGIDGPVWKQTDLEIVIDPQGERSSYYHLLTNPVANSRYDAAVGFIDDPLDPRYNAADVSWNGNWVCENTIRGGKWLAFCKIDFADMGTVLPAPGTVWTFNIGRGAWIQTGGKGPKGDRELELSLWSPSLETLSFHDRESFGEVQFE